jgi:hypothetical protein
VVGTESPAPPSGGIPYRASDRHRGHQRAGRKASERYTR